MVIVLGVLFTFIVSLLFMIAPKVGKAIENLIVDFFKTFYWLFASIFKGAWWLIRATYRGVKGLVVKKA